MLMSRQPAPESDDDSLFGDSEGEGATGEPPAGSSTLARRRIPPNVKVEGLYFDPDVSLPESVALDLLNNIKEKDYFRGGTVNQLMLFERSYDLNSSDGVSPSQEELAQSNLRGDSAAAASSSYSETGSDSSSLPPFLGNLLSVLSDILRPHIPSSTHDLLFPSASDGQETRRKPARQAILNLYRPGEGITPHVDLLKRFGDGIIIVSLGSATVMQLAPVAPSSPSASSSQEDSVDLWLEPRSILVLEKDARYQWTHGIPARKGDWVENDMILSDDDDKAIWVERGVRVSITLRWLLPGAEIVGGVNEDSEMS